jgi:glycolate oxidase FAD binding subunit
MDSVIKQLSETVRGAAKQKRPLCMRGGGTKDFYGGPIHGFELNTSDLRGIVDYEPTELVITARAGTPLAEIEAALREEGQMLAFEPPHFGQSATLGGCVAAGLSGPRRPYAGAVRDFVLGVRMLDGKGDDLKFGGRVMKNVAGYDVSRLMAGSLGTLGVLVEVSLKVLPLPAAEATLLLKRSEGRRGRCPSPRPHTATATSACGFRVRAWQSMPRRKRSVARRSSRTGQIASGPESASRPIHSLQAQSRCGGCR